MPFYPRGAHVLESFRMPNWESFLASARALSAKHDYSQRTFFHGGNSV